MPEDRTFGEGRTVCRAPLLEHLEGTHDTTRIARIDTRGRFGIEHAQTFEQLRGSMGLEFPLEALTQFRIARREPEVEHDARHVEARTADEDRITASAVDILHRSTCPGLVPRDGRVLIDLEDVEEVMRNAPPLAHRYFGGADIHPR